ncbi:MAG: hypothetical protein NZM00_13145 [Anaerolinea sp.]|nr:hypothetical protein [Anaerolinea sp.]
MTRVFSILAAAIAIGTGLLTLAGLLIGGVFAPLTQVFLQIAVVTAALAILIGLGNLLWVHTQRVARRGRGALYSIALLGSVLLVLGLWITGAERENRVVLETVLISVESALAALLAVVLVYGAYRLLRRRVTWTAALFTITVLLVLVAALPVERAGALSAVHEWVLSVPVSAGARGLLLGIALAIIVTGIRLLAGQDRTYSE